jgi:hypothetical protein
MSFIDGAEDAILESPRHEIRPPLSDIAIVHEQDMYFDDAEMVQPLPVRRVFSTAADIR